MKTDPRGRRSTYEAKDWTCPRCEVTYKPIKCSLIDVPQMECTKCNTKNQVAFNFNILKLHRKGIRIRTRVYNQGSTGLCALYSFKAQAEIKTRVIEAESGWFHDQPLDEQDMLVQYEGETGLNFGEEGMNERGEARLDRMLSALKKGVKFKHSKRDSANAVFKVKNSWRTSKKNFQKICELLANGEPLVTSCIVGHNFDKLPHNKVYKSPPYERMHEKGKTIIGHAVCLVGAGARFEKGIYVQYLWFRNSYGEVFGLNGDGMIRFTDITLDPYVISL